MSNVFFFIQKLYRSWLWIVSGMKRFLYFTTSSTISFYFAAIKDE